MLFSLFAAFAVPAIASSSFSTHKSEDVDRFTTTPPPQALYRNSALPVNQRVADLLSRMTSAEKIGQLFSREDGGAGGYNKLIDFCSTTGIGQATIGFAAGTTPAEYITSRNEIQKQCLKNRLNIPISFGQEGLHTGGRGGTLFPESLLTACTWNESLVTKIGAALAYEARGAGVDNTWSPVLNMWTDDRFGRYQEGFSPDPTITSHFSRALILGAQGGMSDQNDYLPNFNTSTWSTGKHYLVSQQYRHALIH
jgi:beta-glucosidase